MAKKSQNTPSRSSKSAEPEPSAQKSAAKQESKRDKVVVLLGRPEGATLADLVTATGWQSHTTRAALTGLKKKGHVIDSEKVDGVRRYRIGQSQ